MAEMASVQKKRVRISSPDALDLETDVVGEEWREAANFVVGALVGFDATDGDGSVPFQQSIIIPDCAVLPSATVLAPTRDETLEGPSAVSAKRSEQSATDHGGEVTMAAVAAESARSSSDENKPDHLRIAVGESSIVMYPFQGDTYAQVDELWTACPALESFPMPSKVERQRLARDLGLPQRRRQFVPSSVVISAVLSNWQPPLDQALIDSISEKIRVHKRLLNSNGDVPSKVAAPPSPTAKQSHDIRKQDQMEQLKRQCAQLKRDLDAAQRDALLVARAYKDEISALRQRVAELSAGPLSDASFGVNTERMVEVLEQEMEEGRSAGLAAAFRETLSSDAFSRLVVLVDKAMKGGGGGK